jgi:hypothetical protein
MLHIFAMVSSVFHVFLQVFNTYVSNTSSVFSRMLQVLYLDDSKINHVLHML